MCGISGFWTRSETFGLEDRLPSLKTMTGQLTHRGPDGSGYWHDDDRGVYLGHRRLSVIDLSDSGRQPMASASGRYVMVFNGEIYNHLDIRASLSASGLTYRGHSDTESLLAMIEAHGLEKALLAANGMFALALWDRQEGVLSLARDRFGKKPLYFGWMGKNLIFGSELKSLRAHPEWSGSIDQEALAYYCRFSYVPAPLSIIKGIRKLSPGCLVEINAESMHRKSVTEHAYWNPSIALSPDSRRSDLNDDRALAEEMEYQFSAAVKRRMISDVPLGAFLSGGIDSSAAVAMMRHHTSEQIRTFTIGFEDRDYDEAPFARKVADHLGTNHTEVYFSKADVQAIIPLLSGIYDEPFADSSQLPTYLVSKVAREAVTVALSGDGGDEVFGGYNRHLWAGRLETVFERWPVAMRKALAAAIGLSPRFLAALINAPRSLLSSGKEIPLLADKIAKFSAGLHADNVDDLYLQFASINSDATTCLQEGRPRALSSAYRPSEAPAKRLAEQFMFCDTLSYLPGDILTKVDRASMAVSLEARCPFLDHELVEWAWTLPLNLKIRNGAGKWPVRRMLAKHVPDALFERPKSGFGIPVGDWLKTDLREWTEDALSPDRLSRHGLLNPAYVERIKNEHFSGTDDHTHKLWNFLMLETWLGQDYV